MSWDELRRELDLWQADGRVAELWWRDDDAVDATAALEQLIALQRRHDVPLLLAVIPARAQPRLAERLKAETGIAIAQHGWAHLNHAPVGRAKAELGPERAPAYVLGELARGALTLDRVLGPEWLRVLVPPHNRIAPAVAAGLAQGGYIGLSTDKPRRDPLPGLSQINTHIDIMDWTTRGFLGAAPALALAVAHLRAKRLGRADPDEPTGLLTHHLAHDDGAWRFADAFLGTVSAHPATRWRAPRELFRPAA
jgi:peptidoglycan/xylan/chitin deacetylase (PgdA/CDA1 family)